MDDAVLYPFATEAEWLERYCKLPVHAGTGTVEEHGASDGRISLIVRRFEQTAGSTDNTQARFDASFVVPATGNCLIFLRWAGKGRLNRNFGKGLIVTGNVPEGEFRLLCPEYRIKTASEGSERPGWSVASPIHQPAIVSYGDPRPIAVVTAIINNFDFDQGNQPRRKGEEAKEVLRVEAAGRCVDFVWRADASTCVGSWKPESLARPRSLRSRSRRGLTLRTTNSQHLPGTSPVCAATSSDNIRAFPSSPCSMPAAGSCGGCCTVWFSRDIALKMHFP